MSHLTSNPFQKPFEFPRPGPLLTPPDTESEYHGQSHSLPTMPSAPMGLGIELEPPTSHRSPSVTEVPISRKLQYIHSGPREARERVVQRSVRWLVIVTPPPSFAQVHGHFGHTLAVGSAERLSQGILMPLFQTMSSQLHAIAREFAFPSTTGLCLYLHTSYGGLAITPRVSDESWPLLWSHLFEPRTPTLPASQLPICGKLEFDIDTRQARWYESWLGIGRRDLVDVPVSVAPSRRESGSHARGDSRTSFFDDQTEEQLDSVSLLHLARPSRTPTHRHIPRKLSLLDRLESSSVRSGSKLVPRNASPPSPDEDLLNRAQIQTALSPIVQESEPRTAQKDIDSFVKSWRISASIAPSPLAATGQTSLDPANIPNDMPVVEPSVAGAEIQSELDLNDFQWSVSSVGPADYDYDDDDDLDCRSLESWRLPSVHLDRRAQGSVCLTPTTCTSFGPPDWDEEPDLDPRAWSLALAALDRIPTPDIAARMLEDCPPTPSTATSWGPPLSWPPSPATPYHVDTPDIGQRAFDIDGPPLRNISRTDTDDRIRQVDEPWRQVWPYVGSSTGANTPDTLPETAASPYTFVFPQRPPSNNHERSDNDNSPASAEPTQAPAARPLAASPGPFSFVWPFFTASTEAPVVVEQPPPEREVNPIEVPTEDGEIDLPPVPRVRKTSPFKFVFPTEKARDRSAPTITSSQNTSSQGGPWNHVWPYTAANDTTAGAVGRVTLAPIDYPYFNIYPAVYPFFDLYPQAAGALSNVIEQSTRLQPSYPNIQPYAPVYPYLEIYPAVVVDEPPSGKADIMVSSDAMAVRLPVGYPHLEIYAAVYPHNLYSIYPEVIGRGKYEVQGKSLPVALPSYYPHMEIYRPVYPFNLGSIYPSYDIVHNGPEGKQAITTRLNVEYPHFDLYPAVYPFDLDTIYPATVIEESALSLQPVEVNLPIYYPTLLLYKPVYPHNLDCIYPSVLVAEKGIQTEDPIIVQLPTRYPNFDIYPAVYPSSLDNIYPPVGLPPSARQFITVDLPVNYPHIQLYRPVYPYNLYEIYPALRARQNVSPPVPPAKSKSSVSTARTHHRREHGHHTRGSSSLSKSIPPVPPLPQNVKSMRPINPVSHRPLSGERMGLSLPVHLMASYPNICPYPPVYPYFDLYPHVATYAELDKVQGIRLEAKYPALDLYPAVYPHFEIYPQVAAAKLSPRPSPPSPAYMYAPRSKPKRSHRDLHEQVLRSMPDLGQRDADTDSWIEPSQSAAISSPHTPTRRLPSPPEFVLSAAPETPSTPPLGVSPIPSPSPSPRSRARSGTVSARPPLPTPPPSSTSLAPPPTPPQAESPTRTLRRLPSIPPDASSNPPSGLPRPISQRGLPSSPAALRRVSGPPLSRSSSFSPLATVPEPDTLEAITPPSTASSSPSRSPVSPLRRPLPQPQLPGELQRSGSVSARLPSMPPPTGAAELARTRSLPSRPLPRARRDSVATPPSGLVAGLAKAYDQNGTAPGLAGEKSPPITLSQLAQFPSPPRPPLPPVPSSKPVSKLDRSKYPFA